MRWISLVCGLAVGSVFVDAETKSEDAPVPPPGYKTRLEILAAYGNGKLEIIERDVPLPDGIVLEMPGSGGFRPQGTCTKISQTSPGGLRVP